MYIISAIIIILIIVGLTSLTNRAAYTQEPTKFYELGQQLSGESFVLAAYGELKGEDSQEIINNFTQGPFSDYIQSTGAEFLVVYGDQNGLTFTRCQYGEGGIVAGISEINQGDLICEESVPLDPNGASIVTIPFQNQNYTINLAANRGYYYVFTKTEGSDRFVSQS